MVMCADLHTVPSGMHLLPISLSPATLRQTLPWSPSSSDPSKFRSLLMHPAKFTSLQLYMQQCPDATESSFAVTKEATDGGFRLGVYGNLRSQPDYAQAAEQIIAACHGSTCRFSALPAAAVPVIRAAFARQGYSEVYSSPCWQYTLQGPLVLQLNAPDLRERLQHQLGSQYELSTLAQEDADLVNNLWTYKGAGSLQMIQQLIQENHTSCIRALPGGQPVAWMLECDPGMGGMLHTLQQHRRKGLARIAVLDLLSKLQQQHQQQTNAILQQSTSDYCGCLNAGCCQEKHLHLTRPQLQTGVWPGGHVYAYVVKDNTASTALFDALGLHRYGEFWWIGFKKLAT